MTLAIPIGLCLSVASAFGQEMTRTMGGTAESVYFALAAGLILLLLLAMIGWSIWSWKRFKALALDNTRNARSIHLICQRLWGKNTEEMPLLPLEPLKTQVWTHDEQWRLRKETGPRER